ncbi:MAG: excinuclease ABC subunit UvrC [bacterium]|nr:excinuclease ABC subunit UvrC [bacterium]
MNSKNHLKTLVNKLPDGPGVYFFKNKGKVIYIGKAISLKKRVRSYFSSTQKPLRTLRLIEQIDDIDFTATDSEESALILERDLVRKNIPKYNVDLKDDKAYPYLKLTLKEDFPRLVLVRRKQDDGAKYYGPYTKVKDLKNFLRFINQLFPLRTCRERLKDKRPCLNYFIKHCVGPCRGEINSSIYKELVSNLDKILKGNYKNIIKDLENKMNAAAKEKRFEDAAQFRDYLFSLRGLIERQKALVAKNVNGMSYPKIEIKRKVDHISEKLSSSLNLNKIARVIEAFDISNIAGENPCGSLVYFKDGIAVPQEYRRFKIKTVEGVDDPRMMAEVVFRRYKRRLEEKTVLPDLILIDGGLTQVNAAYSKLRDLKIADIPIFGLAKKEEILFRPLENIPVKLPFDSEELNYLRRIRDEAHRFALKYHRLRRKKSFLPQF